MRADIIHFILINIVFGIGAGSRYIFFWLIGKKKKYNDLIEPASQDKWNVIVSFTVVGILLYFIVEYGTHLENRLPPISNKVC